MQYLTIQYFHCLSILNKFTEQNFTELMELLHVPLQTLYNFQPVKNRQNHTGIENGHSEKV